MFVAEREVCFEAPRLEFAGVRNLTGIVRFESVAQIVCRSTIEMAAFQALKNIDVFHTAPAGLPRPPSPFGLRRGSLRFRFAVLCFAVWPEFNLRLAEP